MQSTRALTSTEAELINSLRTHADNLPPEAVETANLFHRYAIEIANPNTSIDAKNRLYKFAFHYKGMIDIIVPGLNESEWQTIVNELRNLIQKSKNSSNLNLQSILNFLLQNSMKFIWALIFISVALLMVSLSFEPYKNRAEFEARYEQMQSRDSEKYQALREEMLTPKYVIEDYGFTGLTIAFLAWLALRPKKIKAPQSTWPFVAAAVAAPLLFSLAYVYDLFLGYNRQELPHWADSMGIPLMGLPIICIFGLAWSLPHLIFLAGVKRTSIPLNLSISRRSNPWLIFISVITALLVIECAIAGTYWYIVPLMIWLYLYLALATVRFASAETTATLL